MRPVYAAPTEHRDTVLVLRLWVEPHDSRVRGRLLTPETADGVALLGAEAILAAVADAVRVFADRSTGDVAGTPR